MDTGQLYFGILLFIIWVLIMISHRKKERQKALERQAELLKQSETKDTPG